MKFAVWILRRIRTTVFGGTDGWIKTYREMIIEEKFPSIILTVLFGAIWMMFAGLMAIWLVDDRETGLNVLRGAFLCVPAFYIYNWLAALYVIYTKEKLKTWEALQQ